MMTKPGSQRKVVNMGLFGRDNRFFNSCCCAVLSAMVLEKVPESECDGMVANSAAFRGC
jgi:hypothetical protein